MRLDVLLELLRYVKQQHPELPTRLNTNGLGELENGHEFAAEFKGILDTVSISLNASNEEEYMELCKPRFGKGSYEALISFIEEARDAIPDVTVSVVGGTIPEESEERCRRMAETWNVRFRVRR